MKILITGAGGYIGSVATYLFLQKGYEVVGFDNFSTGYQEPLELLEKKFGETQFRFYKGDLRKDLDDVFSKEKNINAVVHYAASCLVDESMKDPGAYFDNNVHGSHTLLEKIKKHKIKSFVFSSTCAVYGEAEYIPVDEQHPTKPMNPYGESKRMVEIIMEWYKKIYGIEYIVLRYFNVCGASDDGLIGDSKKPSTLLVQNAVRGALGIEPFHLTCPEVETPDKTPIRDYINVVDLNEAHISAVEYLRQGNASDTINLGSGSGNSVMEIVESIKKIIGKQFPIESAVEKRQGEYAKMIASIEKAKQLLKWSPKRTIHDSVNSLVNWYSSHPNGWEK